MVILVRCFNKGFLIKLSQLYFKHAYDLFPPEGYAIKSGRKLTCPAEEGKAIQDHLFFTESYVSPSAIYSHLITVTISNHDHGHHSHKLQQKFLFGVMFRVSFVPLTPIFP
jgi:hypothetical protein